MKLQDVMHNKSEERKTVKINLATTPSVKAFITKKGISPQKVFDLSMKELMAKEVQSNG